MGVTGLGLLAGKGIGAIEGAMRFPGLTGAASFAIGVQWALFADMQVGVSMPFSKLLQNGGLAPDLCKSLSA